MTIRTQVKAGGVSINHNDALRVKSTLKAGAIRRRLETTAPRDERLALLVVRAGLKAGARRKRARDRW
jgi:hypothetical protein